MNENMIPFRSDVVINWSVKRLGQPERFDDKNIRVFLKDQFGKDYDVDFTIEGNKVTFIFEGRLQTKQGRYAIFLIENEGMANMYQFVKKNAFILTDKQCCCMDEMNVGANGEYFVDLESDLIVPANGVGIDDISFVPSYVDEGLNKLTLYLSNGRQYNFGIRNGSKGISDSERINWLEIVDNAGKAANAASEATKNTLEVYNKVKEYTDRIEGVFVEKTVDISSIGGGAWRTENIEVKAGQSVEIICDGYLINDIRDAQYDDIIVENIFDTRYVLNSSYNGSVYVVLERSEGDFDNRSVKVRTSGKSFFERFEEAENKAYEVIAETEGEKNKAIAATNAANEAAENANNMANKASVLADDAKTQATAAFEASELAKGQADAANAAANRANNMANKASVLADDAKTQATAAFEASELAKGQADAANAAANRANTASEQVEEFIEASFLQPELVDVEYVDKVQGILDDCKEATEGANAAIDKAVGLQDKATGALNEYKEIASNLVVEGALNADAVVASLGEHGGKLSELERKVESLNLELSSIKHISLV